MNGYWGELVHRVLPVLGFLAAITIVAELSEIAGVFEVAAAGAARIAGGRVWVLWSLIVLLAVAATSVLSIDTTAVLLTPVVLALARRLGVGLAAFAMTTVWLANTGSLWLPVSNLTNLLAMHRLEQLDVGVAGFVQLTWAPALAAVAVTVALLALLFRRDVAGRYAVGPTTAATDVRGAIRQHDRVLLVACSAICLLLGPAFVTGAPVAWPAAVAAALLIGLFAVRAPAQLSWRLLPWLPLVVVAALFSAAYALSRAGLTDLVARQVGSGTGFVDYLQLAGSGAVTSNAIDNVPAYLALEPIAGESPPRVVALLIGVNCGPLVTVWASLANILWRERCRARGVTVSWWRFGLRGLVLAPLTVVAACAALSLTT